METKGNETTKSVKEIPVWPKEEFIVEKKPEADQQPTVTNTSSVKHESFAVPRFLWTFTENIQGNSFFVQKCLDTMKRYAAKSSFLFTVLNTKNYKGYLKPDTADKIHKIIEMLKERMVK